MARRKEEVEEVVEDEVVEDEVVEDEEDNGPDTEEIVLPTEIAEGALYNVGPVPPELAYLYAPEQP